MEAAAPERCPPAAAATPAGPRGASEPSCPAGRRKPRGGGGPEPLPGRWEGDNGREEGSREAAGPGHRTRSLAKAGKGKRDGGKGRQLKEQRAKRPQLPLREGRRHRERARPCPALPFPVPPSPDTPSAGLRGHGRPAARPSAQDGTKIIRNKLQPGDEPLSGPDSVFFVQVTGFKKSKIKLAQ